MVGRKKKPKKQWKYVTFQNKNNSIHIRRHRRHCHCYWRSVFCNKDVLGKRTALWIAGADYRTVKMVGNKIKAVKCAEINAIKKGANDGVEVINWAEPDEMVCVFFSHSYVRPRLELYRTDNTVAEFFYSWHQKHISQYKFHGKGQDLDSLSPSVWRSHPKAWDTFYYMSQPPTAYLFLRSIFERWWQKHAHTQKWSE